MERLKVFVSHSFDEGDQAVIEKLLSIIQQRKFNFEVRTARNPEPRRFGSKIEDWVDWADVTFGLFTRKYRDPNTNWWLPPPYVISECSYALGRYRDLESKGVHGVVEEGIRHQDLC